PTAPRIKKVFGVVYLDNWVFYQIISSHYFIVTSQRFADNVRTYTLDTCQGLFAKDFILGFFLVSEG
ncbi:hypothetical protein, partial [Weissella confusa]|uniref:hypothetical protein n=1 Tax=Weissella confusa TaxID=1583 RepID=UPI00223A78AF